MGKKTKLVTLPENIVDKGKQVFLNKNDLFEDNPHKMVIGSGTSFKGSDINTDYIEIHGSVSGGIQVNGKATIKKSATVVGTLRYEVISVEEGASLYSDLHCTKADQKLVDKISHLKKTMNQSNLSILSSSSAEEDHNPKEETSNTEKEKKKKRSFF